MRNGKLAMMSVQISNLIPMKNNRNCSPTLRFGKFPVLKRNNNHLLIARSNNITPSRVTNTFHNGSSFFENIKLFFAKIIKKM